MPLRLLVGIAFAVVAVFVVVFTPRAQQNVDWDAVEITTHHVAGTVHYLAGRGGNIGLSIGDDGVVMVDDQFAPLTDRIVETIRGISNGNIRFLVNTHVHGDHVGGNENLGRMGIPIVATERVRVRLAERLPAVALPVLTYDEPVTIHLNGEDVRLIPVPPAHTDGDTFIHFRGSDVLHLGDVFRTVAFPVIDGNNGGTLDGTIEALGIAAGIAGPGTKIVPGHGVVSSREDVIEFRDMIIDVGAKVRALVADGATYDEVLAAGPTAGYEAKWGDPQRFLTAVYAELSGN
ncbi:MAG: MBL fold metallo-hydrolase [Acidobacteria bacterium]|nr:MBL fold metallo-hydrolase [Acidobacteriota bacterium]